MMRGSAVCRSPCLPLTIRGGTIGRNPCLPLTRKVAKPQVLTEGEITYLPICAGFQVLRQEFSPSVCTQACSQLPHQVEPRKRPSSCVLHRWSQENGTVPIFPSIQLIIRGRCASTAPMRSVVTSPSSDEEGVSATCRDDGRRDNVPADLRRFSGSATGVLSLSLHAGVQPAPPSGGAKETA